MVVRRYVCRWLSCAAALALLSAVTTQAAAGESSFHHGQWPFNSPVRPPIPTVRNANWVRNPIDAFIANRWEQSHLQPVHEADKATLLRRVTFDLIGLPPTPAETDAFEADQSPAAYEHVVDRLLASPRFGEHWAQMWLDLVRYAETEGFKADKLRPNAYRYRDYVIDSFNNDRPFDEFIRQQLAGDELEPDNPQALIATGFLRLYPDENNAANLFQRRQEILDDVTDTTSLVFLGLTMGCAQCHDHKFDDIPQTDYYRLQAFFASLSEREDPIAPAHDIAAYHAQLARWESATADVRRQIDTLLQPLRTKLTNFYLEKYEPNIVACYRKPAAERTPLEEQIAQMVAWRIEREFVEKPFIAKLSSADQARYASLNKQLARFDSLKPKPLPTAMAVHDVSLAAPPTHRLQGGSWNRPEQLVTPGFPELVGAEEPEPVPLKRLDHSQPTTGRRTQLADWLTRPDHPLTSRVIVNRLWQQHFGRGIVATPSDFGSQGEQPTHPDLLDWLASELVNHGWSLKHIHRLMVTSATYRLASHSGDSMSAFQQDSKIDSENHLFWHANRRRLEGEEIRDAMLQIAGELNLEMHGPSARPKLPAGVSERYAWTPDTDPAQRNRRSIYVLAKRNLRYPLFEAFDQPDLHQSCPRRAVTVTAPQSLAMLNSELTLELARAWAERLVAEHPASRRDQVQAAYQAAFNRRATKTELELAEKFLDDEIRLIEPDQSPATASTIIDAVAAFCHALFNSNEFITID